MLYLHQYICFFRSCFPAKISHSHCTKTSTFTTTNFTMTFHRSYRNIKTLDVMFLNVTPRRFVVNLVSFRRNIFFISLHFFTLKLITTSSSISANAFWDTRVRKITKSDYQLCHFFCLSVCVSVRPSVRMEQLSMNLISVYFSKIGREKKVNDINTGTLHEDQ